MWGDTQLKLGFIGNGAGGREEERDGGREEGRERERERGGRRVQDVGGLGAEQQVCRKRGERGNELAI